MVAAAQCVSGRVARVQILIGGSTLVESLRGMPALLRYLGIFPDPDGVAHAMVAGPLASLEATDVLLMRQDGDGALVPLGWNRRIEAIDGRVPPMSIASELPIARAYREGEPIAISTEHLHADFPGMAYIEALVGSDRMPQANYLIAAPITCMGRSVGGFWAWVNQGLSADDLPLLSALSSALGLWMTHHRHEQANRPQASPTHLLTARQLEILRRVAEGKTNRVIAGQLGYSESTVKLELSRTLDVLRARDRQEAVHVARSLHLLDS